MDQTLSRLVNTTSGSYSRSVVNRKLRRKRGGGRGEGVETLAHQKIMLQRNKEPENTRSTNYLSLTGLSVFQVTSCDRQSFKGFIFSLGESTT